MITQDSERSSFIKISVLPNTIKEGVVFYNKMVGKIIKVQYNCYIEEKECRHEIYIFCNSML